MTKEMINQIYDDKCERLLQEDEVRFETIDVGLLQSLAC